MIVVEGPDGAGKTTLINYLAKELSLPIAPRVVSKDTEAMVDLQEWVDKNLSKGWQPMIFDRHRLISEPIYGAILRPKFQPGFDDMEWFEPRLRQFYGLQPSMIYCLPPLRTIWDNIQDDPENQRVADQHIIQMIWAAYFNKAVTEYTLLRSTWIYDYTWELAEQTRSVMVKNLKKRIQEHS